VQGGGGKGQNRGGGRDEENKEKFESGDFRLRECSRASEFVSKSNTSVAIVRHFDSGIPIRPMGCLQPTTVDLFKMGHKFTGNRFP
jgi:hypothetical protein